MREGSSPMYILEETMTTILIVVVVLMLFGGGGYYGYPIGSGLEPSP